MPLRRQITNDQKDKEGSTIPLNLCTARRDPQIFPLEDYDHVYVSFLIDYAENFYPIVDIRDCTKDEFMQRSLERWSIWELVDLVLDSPYQSWTELTELFLLKMSLAFQNTQSKIFQIAYETIEQAYEQAQAEGLL